MSYVQKTLLMAAAAPYVIDLGQDVGRLTFSAKGECYVKVAGPGTTPSNPADPTPGAGQVADFIHLLNGDSISVGADIDGKGFVPGLQDPIRYAVIYAKAAADLIMVGH